MKRLFLKAAGVAAAGALLKACGGGGGGGGNNGGVGAGTLTLLQLAEQDGRFSALRSAAERAGLSNTLGDSSASLTLFAPTNEAFDALGARTGYGNANGLIGGLAADKLADLLKFHLLPQIRSESNLNDLGSPGGARPGTLYNFNGEPATLIFVRENNTLNLWDATGRTWMTLTQTDVAASNGVLHVVSDVLVPRGVLKTSQMVRANNQYFSQFGAAMSSGLIQQIDGGNFTLFVPLDSATNVALTDKVVRHHIVSGITSAAAFPPGSAARNFTTLIGQTTRLTPSNPSEVPRGILGRMSDSTSTPALLVDVEFNASNGVIHTIDKRLVPSGGI